MDERSKHLRRLVVRGLVGGNRGHLGSAMSLIEIMRVLYDDVMNYRSTDPKWQGRDRMLLSKGHGCLALYAILADKGFFPVEELDRFCHHDGILGGHPDHWKVPGVEAATGSLGHGLSFGVGMAMAAHIGGASHRVYVVLGDGECQEGSIWEAAMTAGKYRLDNLTVIIDYNKIQSAGFVRDIQDLEPFKEKWEAFGFYVTSADGHDVDDLKLAFEETKRQNIWSQPNAIIAHTEKGHGIPFAENNPAWHHRNGFTPEQVATMNEVLAAEATVE